MTIWPTVDVRTDQEFDNLVAARGSLDGAVIQGLDLTGRDGEICNLDCTGTTFLGCELSDRALHHITHRGALVFPTLPNLPFDPYRPRLYTQSELLEGWDPDDPTTRFNEVARDSKIYAWASDHPSNQTLPVLDALARRLHDLAIDEALRHHLSHHQAVVAVMGGHQLRRGDDTYAEVARLGRQMAQAGWHVATGGGPGAMEAANLGAWMADHRRDQLHQAIDLLASEPDFRDADNYLRAGAHVIEQFGPGHDGLAVPTWFYGHEPTNQFATFVAKYFANSIREDGLLAMATRGIVFTPGSAGTLQEVFQDATQNHYETLNIVSPMVFLNREFWQEILPAAPLLRRLAGDRRYGQLIAVVDTGEEALEFLQANPPIHSTVI